MNNINTTNHSKSDTTDNHLKSLADNGKWDELAKTAESIALYNTRTLFIAVLELAARGNSTEALAAASHLNVPMALLANAAIKADISDLLSNPGRQVLADAWCSLSESVAVRASEEASMKFVTIAPIVVDTDSLFSAANQFFTVRAWKPSAYIFSILASDKRHIHVEWLRQLGISSYLSNDYTQAIEAFNSAIENGDTSPETLAYITWLDERISAAEGFVNE